MPCYTEPTPSEVYDGWERRLRHDSPTADAFCELCQSVESSGGHLPPKAAKWWAEHKERDRKRVEAEIAKKKANEDRESALAKLTPYERSLLQR